MNRSEFTEHLIKHGFVFKPTERDDIYTRTQRIDNVVVADSFTILTNTSAVYTVCVGPKTIMYGIIQLDDIAIKQDANNEFKIYFETTFSI